MNNESYAIIRHGEKQYRIQLNDLIDVELIDKAPGEQVEFEQVLFYSQSGEAHIGAPFLTHCQVQGEILGLVKGEKISSMKYIPGNHYRKFGHRQKYSRVKITHIGPKAT